MIKRMINLKQILTIIFLISIASFWRLYRISEYLTFLGDEGRDVLVVKHILEGELKLLGPTASVGGFFFGSFYYYMMAPFLYLFNYSPVGPAVMVALLGVVTVVLIYILGSKFFGKRAAIIAAILYAISPVVVVYSRSSWNPNPVPFFSLITVYVVYKANEKKKMTLFLLSGLLLGLSIQLHFLVVFLGVVIFLYILITNIYLTDKKNKTNLFSFFAKTYGALFLGFLIGWAPYIIFELRHNFLNTKNILKFVFLSGEVSGKGNFLSIIWDVFSRVYGRLVGNYPSPDQLEWYSSSILLLWYMVIIFVGVSSVILLAYQFKSSYKNNHIDSRKYLLFLLWICIGILLFGVYKKSIYDYYFGFMFPIPFLLTGNVINFLLTQKIRLLKISGIILFISIIGVNLYGIPFKSSGNNQLGQVEKIARFVYEKADGKPFNFALITGGNSDHAYKYFFELWENFPVTIEYPGVDPERKTVTDQLIVVCESLPCQPVGHQLWEIAGFGQSEIVGEWDVSVVKIYKLKHYKAKK